MRATLYARVSTSDQTSAHQLAHAKAAGFETDEVGADNGVSGVTTKLSEREDGTRLLDKLRAGDVVVVRWMDRLGRNSDDAVASIGRFMDVDMGVVLDRDQIDRQFLALSNHNPEAADDPFDRPL